MLENKGNVDHEVYEDDRFSLAQHRVDQRPRVVVDQQKWGHLPLLLRCALSVQGLASRLSSSCPTAER